MSSRVIMRQVALAICIFVCIAVVNTLETPWSNDVQDFIIYTLSDDSGWNLETLGSLSILQMDLGIDVNTLKEDVASSVKDQLHNLSTNFREQINNLLSRWGE